MEQTKTINVGQLTALAVKNKLKQFREIVLIEGNAKLLNELDQVIAHAENKSLPLVEQKNNATHSLIGIIAVLAFIIPWIFGVIDLIKMLLK
jgi:hypothetical protein